MFVICIFVQIGMYLERILIVSGFLSRPELPYNWINYTPHWPEITVTICTFGFLACLYMLFTRVFPIIPLWEVYEGQAKQRMQRVGRAVAPVHTEIH
jgi:molybdopterin-containing oxidoreductase family membrane subunit